MPEYRNPRLRTALIAIDDSGRALLLQHTREHGVYWVFPGGGVDPGETLEDALRREVQEELSVSCRIDRLVAIGELIQANRHVVDFFYTGGIESGADLIIQSEEGITDAGWFSREEISGMRVLPPEIVNILTKIIAGETCGIFYLGEYKVSPES